MPSIDIDSIVAKLAFTSVTPDGSRRPVLLKAVLDAGLRAMRPGQEPGQGGRNLLVQLVEATSKLAEAQSATELSALRRRTEELEKRVASTASEFTPDEIAYIRVCHEYGMSLRQLAEFYEVDVRRIAVACGKKMVGRPPGKKNRRQLQLG